MCTFFGSFPKETRKKPWIMNPKHPDLGFPILSKQLNENNLQGIGLKIWIFTKKIPPPLGKILNFHAFYPPRGASQ